MRSYYNVNIDDLKVGDTIAPLHREILILEVSAEENAVVFILVNVLGGCRQPQYDVRYRLTREDFLLMLQRMGPVNKEADMFGAGAFQASAVQTVLAVSAYSKSASGLYVTSETPPF